MTAQDREVPRVAPDRAWRMVQDEDALLICAYDDEDKCSDFSLPGSISADALRERRNALERDRRLVFYCG